MVTGWGASRRPVVARRPGLLEPAGAVAVGLPLPPSLGKLRVALFLPPGTAWQRRAAVPLAEARASAPRDWHDTIAQLGLLGDATGLRPAVFGALLWQHLTGLPYLHSGSDLDLLWPVDEGAVLLALLNGLRRLDECAPMRLDGEILTPAGAVSWRELDLARFRGGSVLVKSLTRAELLPVERLYERKQVPC